MSACLVSVFSCNICQRALPRIEYNHNGFHRNEDEGYIKYHMELHAHHRISHSPCCTRHNDPDECLKYFDKGDHHSCNGYKSTLSPYENQGLLDGRQRSSTAAGEHFSWIEFLRNTENGW